MRTKVDKDHKKAAEKKFNINLPSPKVVLNANECARFLDQMGKASVILVEKAGKMVASSKATASSAAASTSATSGAVDSPPKTGLSSAMPSASATVAASSVPREKGDFIDPASLNAHTLPGGAEQTKVILKPPKKRRGMDKKLFEETAPAYLSNGELLHQVISPLRDSVDMTEGTGSSTAETGNRHRAVESLQKHSVDGLLQSESSPIGNNNNNNSLISGTFTHRPYDSLSHHPQQPQPLSLAEPVSQTTVALSSPSMPSSSLISSSSSSSQVSTMLTNEHGANSFHATSVHSSALGQTSTMYSSHQTFPSSPGARGEKQTLLPSDSSDAIKGASLHNRLYAPRDSSPAHIPANKPVVCIAAGESSACDQRLQLPEQEEPMNLSTNSKPVVSLVTSQAQSNTSPTESRSVEDDQTYPTEPRLGLSTTDSSGRRELYPQDSSSEHRSRAAPTKAGFKLHRKKSPKRVRSPLESETSAYHIETDIGKMKQLSEGESLSVGQSENMKVSSNSHSETSHSSSKMSKEQQGLTVQNNTSSESGTCPAKEETQTSGSDANRALCPPTLSHSTDPSNTFSESDANGTSNSAPSELLVMNSSTASKPLPGTHSVVDVPLKSKKPPKKRVEIAMDEASCAGRIARYSDSIDDVIANFVYVPEPVEEEFSLTEEEEAAIREQFETGEAMSVGVQGEGSGKSIKEGVEAVSAQSASNREEKASEAVCETQVAPVPSKSSPEPVKPPKKRATPLTEEGALPAKVVLKKSDNIDSVLAFVASDVSRSAPLPDTNSKESEEPKGEVTAKKKKKVPKVKSGEKTGLEDAESKKKKKKKKDKDAGTGEVLVNGHAENVDSTVVGEKVSCDKEVERSNVKKTLTPKKPRKRKSDGEVKTGVESSSANKEQETVMLEGETVQKKKKNGGKSRSAKKKLTEKSAELKTSPVASDKDASRLETSDIGESIASTSGSSEQDTPVHEPEMKDGTTNTELIGINKESPDTGLESAGEADSKPGSEDADNRPVRKYKKRLDFVKCTQCEHQARGRSALSRHMKKVHRVDVDMPYRCEHCTYGCTKMASLNRHLFTHGVFPCSRCTFVSDERAKLMEHVMEQHKDKLDMKLCKVCNRYIKCDKVTIEEHMAACAGPTPFKCTECDKEFKYGSSLRVHYHTHFPDQPKRFKCELCDYKTNYKANLHKHHKNMHASRDRDVACPDCHKMFSTEDNMRRHRKVHTLVRPFACETCKKTFKTSGALKGHQLIHTATRPYICSIPGCNRSFRTPKFLKSHQEEYHRLVPKKFFCSVEGCGYSFFKRSHLKRHAITHTGERNFHCTWPGCSKSFRHADNLKVHFRGHTNEKPVQCNLCEFKCKQKNSLFWHKKKVHQVIDTTMLKRELKHEAVGGFDSGDIFTCADDGATREGVRDGQKFLVLDGSKLLNLEEKGEVSEIQENSSHGEDKDQAVDTVVETTDLNKSFAESDELVIETVKLDSKGHKDLYEFKSDEESEEESPTAFRRDKTVLNVMTPLPPPPKELLRKNELLEKKEMEKKERAEKKEQEKKERLEKKVQEKKEKAEKKEQEKKEKAEKRELERKEKEEKKEQEKKEREEKKEQEKREKDEKKEQERKEKEDKKEQERKEKEDKKEQERKEREEKKEQERRLKQELKDKLKKERQALLLQRKKSASQKAKEKKLEAKKQTSPQLRAKEAVDAKTKISPRKKSPAIASRRKSPGRGAKEPAEVPETKPGKRKKKVVKEDKAEDEKEVPQKMKKKSVKKEEPTVSVPSPRAASKKTPPKKVVVVRGRKKMPPKRKPSARIKANKKALAKKVKAKPMVKKSVKGAPKKKVGRKRSGVSAKVEREEEIEEVEEDVQEAEEEKEKEVSAQDQEEVSSPRPPSPDYYEENMLQGKGSPYRDFSDAEEQEAEEEDKETEVHEELPKFSGSPSQENMDPSSAAEENNPEMEEEEEEKVEGADADPSAAEELDSTIQYPPDESSDDEVSNDIPLTPPRAPAPPPVESSEDEMEPEPEPEPVSVPGPTTPFSVPGPTTPFSVPGPNTPFSVPPPTNMMQQHSVHSEETPLSAVTSVPSTEYPSGSVEAQQSQGSVEMAPHGSVEMPHHGSVEMPHHGSVEMPHHGSVEMPHHGSVEMPHHGSVDMPHHGSVEMPHHGSVDMPHHGSVEMPHHGSVDMPHHGSVEMPHHGSVDMPRHGSVEMPHHGSVDMPHHSSVEMPHHSSVDMPHRSSVEMPHHSSVDMPHRSSVDIPHHASVEMPHRGSVEMSSHGSGEMLPRGSSEMPPHGSVEMQSHGSVEMPLQRSVEMPTHGSVDMPSHGSREMLPRGSLEMPPHGSVEMPPTRSVEMSQSQNSLPEHHLSQMEQQHQMASQDSSQDSSRRDSNSSMSNHVKYELPPSQGPEADKEYFDQYLKSLSAANNRAANGGLSPSPSGLQQLEAMVDKSHTNARQLASKSPVSSMHSAVPTSVITSLEGSLPLLPTDDLRSRMELLRHHDLHPRETSSSSLPRLPERQTTTPLTPNPTPVAPAFDTFPALNPLHPTPPAAPGRDTSYLRQPDNLFPTPPVTSSFMAEAMFQRQAMTTPFLPHPSQSSDRSSLSRIPDATPLRSSNSSLLRRSSGMPGTDMFTPPTIPQAMPRNPFTNAWTGQEVRPPHWQSPYLPRQPNMATAGNPFFPSKDNYLTGREFMFDPSVRQSAAERGMFPSLSSSQAQESLPLDRFDLSTYFPNAVASYTGSPSSLDYTRSAHSAAPKPFDERYRQTAATSATIPDFRGLPPTTASTDMFTGIGVNSGFNLYPSNPMSYHPQHMTDNVNSAFLSHSTSAQHAMFERDYAAAAAHRGLYPHQNSAYPFIDERQYSGASKLGHSHPAPTPGAQERDLMSRSAAPESQMQDPYRSMLYRY